MSPSYLHLREGEKVEEVNPYDLALNMNPVEKDCNFNAAVNPSFFENRPQHNDPERLEEWLRTTFLERFKADNVFFELDPEGHLAKLTVETRPYPLESNKGTTNTCSIIWEDNRCSTSGIQTLHQFMILFELFARDFHNKARELSREKKVIPAPLNFEIVSAEPDSYLSIYAAPSFMEGFRKMAESNPSYYYHPLEGGFASAIIEELQRRGRGDFSSFFDNPCGLFYFGNNGYLRSIQAPNAPFGISLGIGGDTSEEIIKHEGCLYTPHNPDMTNNRILATFILIFWLIAKEIKKFHAK